MAELLYFDPLDQGRAYCKADLQRECALAERKLAAWRLAKQAVLLLLLVAAYLGYFLISVELEALTLPALQVNVPIAPPTSLGVRSALHNPTVT